MTIDNARLKKALYKVEMQELAYWDSLPEVDHQYSKECVEAIDRIIERVNSGKTKRINFRKLLIAAAAAAILTTLLTVTAYGKEIFDFITQYFEDHIRITTENDIDSIEEAYAPTWVGEGYSLAYSDNSGSSNVLMWRNEANTIIFRQNLNGSINDYDNEGVEVSTIFVDGTAVFCTSKHNTYTFVWTDGKYTFNLTFNHQVSDTEAERIIRSVAPIDQ